MPVKKRPFKQAFQYRLIWRYVGDRRTRELRADRPLPVLNMLRRIGTNEPWTGTTKSSLKRAWARLCLRLGVPFAQVEGLGPREVVKRIQDSYPRLDWIRVEQRQVGEWTETIDPLNALRQAGSDKTDAKRAELFDHIASLPPEELDKWRSYVTDDYRGRHKRVDAAPAERRKEPTNA